MGYRRITVKGLRKRPFDPERPAHRILLFENDRRHPRGQACVMEGHVAEVYPTAAVKKLISSGQVEQIDEAAAAEAVEARADAQAVAAAARAAGDAATAAEAAGVAAGDDSIHPESLFNLKLDDPTIQALEGAGIDTMGALVDAWRTGEVQTVKGVGRARLESIGHALVEAGQLAESDLD